MGKFTAIKTYSRFLSLWNEDKIDRNSLTFILDTGQLYTHGIFLNSVAYGTEANGAIDITIAGTSKSLSLSSHTHSNYLEKDKNIDIGTYKIVSGDKDLLYYNAGNTYLGNSASPVYLVGTEGKIVKGNSTYTLLDTGNFSIAGKTSSGVILSNTALFTYGDKTFQIDYIRRYNSTSNFDSLNSVTSAGTTTVNGYKYGFITLNEDGATNPSWSLIRIDVANRKLEFRTSSNPNAWVSPITSVPTNTATVAGIVSAPGENNSGKVWKTDASGTPAWRDEIPNTWRNIRINDEETDSLAKGTGTGALYIKEGSGIKVTWEGNKIIIKNDSLNVWNANAVGVAGYVAAPTKADNANMTWLTDADGNPAWRASNNHSHNYLPLSGGLITDTVIAMNSAGLPTYGGNIVPTYNTAIGKNGIAFGGIDSSSDGAAIYLLNRGSDLNSLIISIGDNYSNTGTDEIEFRYCNWDGNYYSIGVPHKTGTIALTSDLGSYLPLSGGTVTGQTFFSKTGSSTNSALVVGGTSTAISPYVADQTSMIQIVAGSGGSTNSSAIGFHNPNISSAVLEWRDNGNQHYFNFRNDRSTNDIRINGYSIWHADNDGSGSGLDADTVDGLHASDLMSRVLADGSIALNATSFAHNAIIGTINGNTYTGSNGKDLDNRSIILHFSGGKYTGHWNLIYINSGSMAFRTEDHQDWWEILHSGNYSSYTLPISGGIMNAGAIISWADWNLWGADSPTYPKAQGGLLWTGTSDSLKLFAEETTSDDLRLILQCGDDSSPSFDIRRADGTTTIRLYSDGTITGTSIINSGSNDSYVLLGGGGTKLISDFLQRRDICSHMDDLYNLRYNYGGFDKCDYNGTYASDYPACYGLYISLAYDDKNSAVLLFFDCPGGKQSGPKPIYVRTRGAGDNVLEYSPWGALAYLTDNVASATKLQTARTIWGQSFDGTGNVDGNFKMTTGDQMNFQDPNNDGVAFNYNNGGKSTNSSIRIYNGRYGEWARFDQSGYFGIGTTSPVEKLDVVGNIRSVTSSRSGWSYRIIAGNTTDGVAFLGTYNNGSLVPGVYSHNEPLNSWNDVGIGGTTIRFYLNGTENSRLDLTGLGIGTTSPSYKLDVAGTGRIRESLIVSSNNTTGGGIILADDGDIVDLNDAYCSMRFSYGVRIYSANRGGSWMHELNADGKLSNYGVIHRNYNSYSYLLTSNGDARPISSLPYLSWKEQWIDMTGYSESYWHPVVTDLPYKGYNRVKVTVQLNSGSVPSWSSHTGGFTCNLDLWTTAHGWGTTRSETICLNSSYGFTDQNPVGWCLLGNNSHGILLLRGGGKYLVCTDWDSSWTIYNQSVTEYEGTLYEQTCGPYTSWPGIFNGSTTKNTIYANLDGNASSASSVAWDNVTNKPSLVPANTINWDATPTAAKAYIFNDLGYKSSSSTRNYFPWIGSIDRVTDAGFGNTVSIGAYHASTADCGVYIGASWDGSTHDTYFTFSRYGDFTCPGNVGIGTNSPGYTLHVNGSTYLGKTTLDNTPFTDSVQILANNSNESDNDSININCASHGITFVRDWANGGHRCKEAGIYMVGSYNWKGGLVFRTKNNTNVSGTHDTNALLLVPDGRAFFVNNVYATNFYTTSDRLKKQNISSFSEHIRKFQLKDTEKWHYGVIAQEVPEIFRDGEEGNMTVNYNSVLSYYVGALENSVAGLEDAKQLLENRVKELENEILKLKNK